MIKAEHPELTRARKLRWESAKLSAKHIVSCCGGLFSRGFVPAVFIICVVAQFLGGSLASACSIPVFRYALDRWPADAYRLEVSATDAQDEAVARFLRNLGTSSPYNLQGVRHLTAEAGGSSLLFPPGKDGESATAWSGKVEPDMLARLVQSPVRKKIVEAIIEGASGVWVFVESGDAAADDAAVAKLEKRLRYLENVAQLPRIDPNDPTSKLGPGPRLQVKFVVYRVKSQDIAEDMTLRMLAGAKAGADLGNGGWLAAVFGRGRVLGAWPVKGFGDEQVEEVCLFLLGACSCQVKNLNPGWDMLLSADWDAELLQAEKRAVQQSTEVITPVKAEVAEAPETVKIAASPAPVGPVELKQLDHNQGNDHVRSEVVEFSWITVAGVMLVIAAGVIYWFGGSAKR